MTILQSQITTASEAFAANSERMQALVNDIRAKAELVNKGGTDEARERHTSRGKLLPRDRLAQLLDSGSPFLEIGQFAAWDMYGDTISSAGIIAGIGRVSGKEVMIVINDATVKGGIYYPLTVKKHLRAQEIAMQNNLPCLYLVDSGGANLRNQDEVFPDREHFGRIFYNQANMSAAGIPQIAVVMGSCTSGGAYISGMSEETIVVTGQGTNFLTDLPWVMSEILSAEDLDGAAEVHTRKSSLADHYAMDDAHALATARRIVGNLNRKKEIGLDLREVIPPLYDPHELYGIIPTDLPQLYDAHELIARIVDGSEFDEFKQNYGTTLITGFAHLYGMPVGIIANNGVLFSESALKGTHFIELCTQRGIPLVFLQNNITGLMIGGELGVYGIAQEAAMLVTAVATTHVPKVTMIVGGSFGAGNYGMCGRAFSPRFLWMWPNASVSRMDNEKKATMLILEKQEGEYNELDWVAEEEVGYPESIYKLLKRDCQPLYSSARLWDDGIIDPAKSREVLALSLAATLNARR